MAQKSCSYTFRGPDGENVVLRGMAAIKAFLASGGLEYLRAPEARQSRARDVTETPAFKKWFGDSKVVDAEGKPLVVYHGTKSESPIEAFDSSRIGSATDPGFMGSGFYFGDAHAANSYAGAYVFATEYNTPGGAVYPVYLSLQNPLVLYGKKEGRRIRDRGALAREAVGLQSSATAAELRAAIVGANHDGVIYRDDLGTQEFVAFYPTQIKSAIGNNGQFDPTNPDIRKSEERSGSIIYGGQGGLPASKRPTAEQIERGYAAQRSVVAGMDRAYRQEVKKFLAQNPNPRAPGDDGIDAALNTYIHKDGDRLAVLQARNSQPTRPRTLAYVNGDSVQWLYSPGFLPPGINTETALAAAKKGAGAYLLDGENFESSLRNIRKSEERSLDNFRKELLSKVQANAAMAKMRSAAHEWAFNVGDQLLSTQTGKVYKLTGRTFQRVGPLKNNDWQPVYSYSTGEPPPANATREERDGWDKDYEQGMFPEQRILESKTLKSLTTPIMRSQQREFTVDMSAAREAEKPAKDWIEKVYAQLPRNPMMPRQRIMMLGEEDFAVVEMAPSVTSPGAADIQWIQAYPMRKGNGTKAIRELQRMAAEDNIPLTLWPWDKGRVSQSKLIKFYQSVDFEPIKRGGKDMIWRPSQEVRRSAERPWYGQLERAIEGMPARLDNQSAAQWSQWLKANAGKLGVKQDEVTWSGIEDFLKLKGKEKLSKAEIGAFLAQNGVRVEEVTLGVTGMAAKYQQEMRELQDLRRRADEGEKGAIDEDELDRLRQLEQAAGSRTPTKYDQYTLPGGANYREVLLTLPERRTLTKAWRDAQESYGDDDQRTIDAKRAAKAEAGPQQGYKSSHWDQRNILAHLRLNDRTDADGAKVLFVEEIQSDFAQDARKKGIQSSYKLEDVQPHGGPLPATFYYLKTPDNVFQILKSQHASEQAAREYIVREKKINSNGVPSAPFIDDTSKWLNLALKRVISLATSEGYDSVAFVTGEQSAERYDLSKQVSRVAIIQSLNIKTGKPVNDGMLIAYDLSGKETISKYLKSESDIEELVGKEVAARLIAAKPVDTKEIVGTTRRRELKGLDLSVGGEGMKAFYDQIVPQAASALVKKMGGEGMTTVTIGSSRLRVQEAPGDDGFVIFDEKTKEFYRGGSSGRPWVDYPKNAKVYLSEASAKKALPQIEGGAAGMDQPGFTITPTMREKAAGGMPLFSRERATDTPEFKRWFGDSKVVDEDGRPMVMYHGTENPGFTEFDRKKSLEWRGPSMDTVGSWFSNNPSESDGAGLYGRTIYPVYLSIQNPKRYSTFQAFLRDMHKAAGRKMPENAPGRGSAEELHAKLKGEGYDGIEFEQTASESLMQDIKEMQDAVERAKQDEFSVKRADRLPYTQKRERLEQTLKSMRKELDEFGSSTEFDGQRVFIAFEPTQIKSATGNDGGFDPGNPDITKSRERTETPEFKAWFKDSKVADENGRPAVVYHGTAQEKDRFRREGGGAGPGVWFSTSPKLASTYAQMDTEVGDGGGPAVMPVYLSIKNPIILTGMESYAFDWEQRSEWEGLGHDGAHNPEAGEWIAFEPTQIKSAIGNDGSFDDNDPNILSSAARAWESPGASKFDDIVYKVQDKQIDLKRIVEAVKDAKGALANDRDTYLREELFHGRAAKRTEDFVSKELQPLVDEMAKRGLTIEDLDQYLHARHAPEANRLIAERNPDSPLLQDGGSGLDTVLAQQYMADLGADKKAHLEAAAAKVDAILAQTRRLVVDYELESKDTVDGWGEMFDHYVPLMREDDGASVGGLGTGQGFSVKGRETKSRTGSTKKVVDILANIAMQRERTIVRGEKNRVAQSLVALAKENPNKDFWTVDLTPTTPTFDPKKGVVVQRPDPMFKARPNVVVAKIREEDGSVKEHAVIFSEKDERALRMATAMKNLDNTALDGLMGSAAKITRYFSAIVTSYNPVFGGVNYIRDFQAVMINLKSTPLDGMQKQVAVDSMKAMKAIYQNVRTGATTTEWQKLWEEFQDVGGQTGFRQLFANSQDRADSINAAINPDYWMDSKFGKVFTANGVLKMPISQASKIVKAGFKWLQDYNDALENATRLAVYKAGLDKGLTKEEAASIAKNISANFNRKGQMGQQVGALYAFANASAQGSARLGQLLFDMEPGKPKTIRLSRVGKRIVSGGVLLGVAQALALMAAGFDDEDPPAFVRERSLVIPTGGKGYISIPMPLGLHVLPNFGRVTTEWAMGGFKKTPQRAIGFAGLLAEAFVPTGSSGLSMQTIAPTMLDPLVALSENKDWQGRPIAKESRNPATPGHSLMKDSATTWSRQLAEMINYATGGNEYVAGALSPTPDQLDYVASALGGGVAKEISKLEQSVRGLITGEEVPTFKIPLVGRFVGSAASQASEGGAFYASSAKLNELETEIKGLQKDGKMAEAAALKASRPDAYLIAQVNLAERQIQKLKKEKSELVKAGAERAAVRALEEKITARMAAFNRAADALREKAGS